MPEGSLTVPFVTVVTNPMMGYVQAPFLSAQGLKDTLILCPLSLKSVEIRAPCLSDRKFYRWNGSSLRFWLGEGLLISGTW